MHLWPEGPVYNGSQGCRYGIGHTQPHPWDMTWGWGQGRFSAEAILPLTGTASSFPKQLASQVRVAGNPCWRKCHICPYCATHGLIMLLCINGKGKRREASGLSLCNRVSGKEPAEGLQIEPGRWEEVVTSFLCF